MSSSDAVATAGITTRIRQADSFRNTLHLWVIRLTGILVTDPARTQ